MKIYVTPETVQVDDGKEIKGITYSELRELIEKSPKLTRSVSFGKIGIEIDMVV